MKLGPLEILIILFVAFSAGLMVRLFRGDKRQEEKRQVEVVPGREVTTGPRRLKMAGAGLVVLGIIILLFGISTFEMVMKMYVWAFVLVVAGLAALMITRNR